MRQETYPYKNILYGKYSFTSIGKKRIVKIVEFTLIGSGDVVNLAFGDSLADTNLDDFIVSDNGDIIKVIATVIKVMQEFTAEFPHLTIAFAGSTPGRMKLYHRILKMYYAEISKEFHISGIIKEASTMIYVEFDPTIQRNYITYFVKRKS
jgi:hypothetical protein